MPTLVKKLNNKKKSNNIKKGKGRKEKPLNLNDRNNGSQAYKIVKKATNKANRPKGSPWVS